MSDKIKLNVLADRHVVEEFRNQAGAFNGRIGDCLAGSMLMWLRSDPKEQADLLKELHDAEVDKGMATLVQVALARQTELVKERVRPR